MQNERHSVSVPFVLFCVDKKMRRRRRTKPAFWPAPQVRRKFGAKRRISGGRALPARGSKSLKGGAARGREAQDKKIHLLSQMDFFILVGTVKTDISDLQQHFKRTAQRPFWAAPQVRRKFGAAGGGGELRRGGFADPEHSNTEGWRPPMAAGTQNKRHDRWSCLLFWYARSRSEARCAGGTPGRCGSLPKKASAKHEA